MIVEGSSAFKKLKTLVLQRNALIIPLIALSISTVFLASAVQSKKDRIVVIPTKGTTLWLEKTNCSKEYLETFGLYLSSLLFTKDVISSPIKMKEILTYAHPSKRQFFQTFLEEELAQMKKDKTSFSFETKNYFVREDKKTFVLEGTQKTYYPKGGKTEVEEENLRYQLIFKMEEGNLQLTNMIKEKK